MADTGFREAVLLGSEYNEGALLENAVFIELLRRGYDVCVGSYKDKEVDFTSWRDGEPEFYQVALSLADGEVLRRELSSLKRLDAVRKTVITMDRDLPDMPDGIQAVSAVDFFLGNE